MKLAFSTLGCPEWTFDEVLAHAETMGFQGIEIRGIGSEMRIDRIGAFSKSCQHETLQKLKDRRLTLCCVGTSVRFDEPGTAALEEGKAAVEVCARMGIPFLRVFGDSRRGQMSMDALIGAVTEGCAQLCSDADGTDVQVLLEVHGDFDRADRMLEVVRGVSSDRFGVLWDIEHTDAVYGDGVEAFYSELMPYVKHVHIKDAVRTPQGHVLCGVGEGDLPIRRVVRMMEQANYQGFYSLEWEKKWHPELLAADIAFAQYVRYMQSL